MKTITDKQFEAARKAYGKAIFEFYDGFKVHEECDVPPTLASCQDDPEHYDGVSGGENMTDELITAYLNLTVIERNLRARKLGKEPEHGAIDNLVEAFEAWIDAPTQYAEKTA